MRTIIDAQLEFPDEVFYWKAIYVYSAIRDRHMMKKFLLKKKVILLYMLKGFKHDYEDFENLKIYQICYILEIFYRFWTCKWNLFFVDFLIKTDPYYIRKIFKQIYNTFTKYPYKYERHVKKLFALKIFLFLKNKIDQKKFLKIKNVIRFPYTDLRFEDEEECIEKKEAAIRINERRWRYKNIYFYKLFPFWGLYFVSKWIIYINRIIFYFWVTNIIKFYYMLFLDVIINDLFVKKNYFVNFNSFLNKDIYKQKYFFYFLSKSRFNIIDPLELWEEDILNKNYYLMDFYLCTLKSVI